MLGYLAAAFAYGALKASAVGRKQEHFSKFLHASSFGLGELSEELEFRVGAEQLIAKGALGMAPAPARIVSSALFGLTHPGNVAEATLGGLAYSYVYARHGLLGSFLTHAAHNLGCWAGSH